MVFIFIFNSFTLALFLCAIELDFIKSYFLIFISVLPLF